MHEYSLACEIFENVIATAQANNASVVNSITLNIGRLAHVNPEQLLFSFNIIAKNSIAGDAEMNIEFTAPTVECVCGYKGNADEVMEKTDRDSQPYLHEYIGIACPVCDGVLQTVGGRELIIQTIDIEQE